MNFHSSVFAFVAVVLGICVAVLPGTTHTSASQGETATAAGTTAREDAYRANNLGVALLEQYKYKEGAEAFGRALQLDPKLAPARINLSIALYKKPDPRGAQRGAEAAAPPPPRPALPPFTRTLPLHTAPPRRGARGGPDPPPPLAPNAPQPLYIMGL